MSIIHDKEADAFAYNNPPAPPERMSDEEFAQYMLSVKDIEIEQFFGSLPEQDKVIARVAYDDVMNGHNRRERLRRGHLLDKFDAALGRSDRHDRRTGRRQKGASVYLSYDDLCRFYDALLSQSNDAEDLAVRDFLTSRGY